MTLSFVDIVVNIAIVIVDIFRQKDVGTGPNVGRPGQQWGARHGEHQNIIQGVSKKNALL